MYRKGVFSFLLLLLLAACSENHEQMLRQLEEPAEICKLTGISDGYAANLRKRLLLRIFGEEGSPKGFDRRIIGIK